MDRPVSKFLEVTEQPTVVASKRQGRLINLPASNGRDLLLCINQFALAGCSIHPTPRTMIHPVTADCHTGS